MFESPAMQTTVAQIAVAAATHESLIVCGEPGTGREQVARVIAGRRCALAHTSESTDDGASDRAVAQSARALSGHEHGDAPVFVVDCGIPDVRALEADVFGTTSQPVPDPDESLDTLGGGSLLVQACGGAIVLRNLAEFPLRLQHRLARLLREREALLADRARSRIDLDVRAIALLEPGFEQLIFERRLAPELMKRLGGTRVDIPPLGSRREDVPGLIAWMIESLAAQMHIPPKRVSDGAAQLLSALPWRKNLPELRGLLQVLMARVPGPVVRLSDVLAYVCLDGATTRPQVVSGTLKEARERFEREYVAFVLEQHEGRMADAAKVLGIERTNLYRKVRQLSVGRANDRREL